MLWIRSGLVQIGFAIDATGSLRSFAEPRLHKKRKLSMGTLVRLVSAGSFEVVGAAEVHKSKFVLADANGFGRGHQDAVSALLQACARSGEDRQFFVARGNDQTNRFAPTKLRDLINKVRLDAG